MITFVLSKYPSWEGGAKPMSAQSYLLIQSSYSRYFKYWSYLGSMRNREMTARQLRGNEDLARTLPQVPGGTPGQSNRHPPSERSARAGHGGRGYPRSPDAPFSGVTTRETCAQPPNSERQLCLGVRPPLRAQGTHANSGADNFLWMC